MRVEIKSDQQRAGPVSMARRSPDGSDPLAVLSRRAIAAAPSAFLTLSGSLLFPTPALAHGVTDAAKQRMMDGGPLDFAWAGAEHMLTGYDHLLFLMGVMFLMSRFIDIIKFATVFTLGHTITLIGATKAGIRVDHFLIDAFIALTVIYIGFLNLGGFRRLGVAAPPLLLLVFGFGLIHGLGLSTGIQEMTLRGDPTLTGKLLAFNIGVEAGQIAALAFVAAILRLWRGSAAWAPLSRAANAAIVLAGVVLLGLQLHGFLTEPPVAAPHAHHVV